MPFIRLSSIICGRQLNEDLLSLTANCHLAGLILLQSTVDCSVVFVDDFRLVFALRHFVHRSHHCTEQITRTVNDTIIIFQINSPTSLSLVANHLVIFSASFLRDSHTGAMIGQQTLHQPPSSNGTSCCRATSCMVLCII